MLLAIFLLADDERKNTIELNVAAQLGPSTVGYSFKLVIVGSDAVLVGLGVLGLWEMQRGKDSWFGV